MSKTGRKKNTQRHTHTEEFAHAAGTHTHKHLIKLGARAIEKRHVSLAGDGAGQERLACAWGPIEQHTLGQLAAEPRELGRVAQELDNLAQVGAQEKTVNTS